MTRILVYCCCLFISIGSLAQSRTYIGAEVAHSVDLFKINDIGSNRLSVPDISSVLWGINIRHELKNKYLFVEGGIYTRKYTTGISFEGSDPLSKHHKTAILFPLRMGGRLPFFKGVVALSAVAGPTLAFTNGGEYVQGRGTYDPPGNTLIRYSYTNQHLTNTFILLQGGMGIDIRLGRTMLSLSANYYNSVNPMLEQYIPYNTEVNDGRPATRSKQNSKGSFYTVGVGIKREVNWLK